MSQQNITRLFCLNQIYPGQTIKSSLGTIITMYMKNSAGTTSFYVYVNKYHHALELQIFLLTILTKGPAMREKRSFLVDTGILRRPWSTDVQDRYREQTS